MFYFLIIPFIIFVDATTERVPLACFSPCAFELNPVCTTNGTAYKLFTNKCVLDSENCIEDTEWKEVNASFCTKTSAKTIEACNKKCDYHSAPICGFDGYTYQLFWNKCFKLEKECIDGIKRKAVPLENCKQDKVCTAVCPTHQYYICASNGTTALWYRNSCFVELANCREKEIAKRWKVVENCECKIRSYTVLKRRCEHKCEPIYDPICGIDGKKKKTFVNVCELTTYNCLNCTKFTVLRPKAC